MLASIPTHEAEIAVGRCFLEVNEIICYLKCWKEKSQPLTVCTQPHGWFRPHGGSSRSWVWLVQEDISRKAIVHYELPDFVQLDITISRKLQTSFSSPFRIHMVLQSSQMSVKRTDYRVCSEETPTGYEDGQLLEAVSHE